MVVILVVFLRIEVLHTFPGSFKDLPAFTEYEEAQERYWLPVFVRQGHGCHCKFPSAKLLQKLKTAMGTGTWGMRDKFIMFQASLIGAEFGKQFRGFAELGVGEQGFLLAGIRYKF